MRANVLGIFVSIPSESLFPSLERCRLRGVPIVSINSGYELLSEADMSVKGILHHIGMLEFVAGSDTAAIRQLHYVAHLYEAALSYQMSLLDTAKHET